MKKSFLYVILLVSLLVWQSCKEDDPAVQLTEFHFTARVDGDSLTVIDQSTVPGGLGYYADKDSIGIDGVNCIVSYQSQFRDIANVSFQGVFFTFNRYYNGECAKEPEDFRTLFQPELQPVADGEGVRGWIFQYRDDAGKLWSTLKGDQSNNRLEIKSTESITDDARFGFKRQKITGTLNCSVYDDNNNSLEISNGKFSIYIASYDW